MTGERTRALRRGSSEQKTAGQESGVERASNKEQRTRHAAGWRTKGLLIERAKTKQTWP